MTRTILAFSILALPTFALAAPVTWTFELEVSSVSGTSGVCVGGVALGDTLTWTSTWDTATAGSCSTGGCDYYDAGTTVVTHDGAAFFEGPLRLEVVDPGDIFSLLVDTAVISGETYQARLILDDTTGTALDSTAIPDPLQPDAFADRFLQIRRSGCSFYADVVSVTEGAGNPDSDGDSIPDEVDACPGFDDLADEDGDTVADGCDACLGDALNDQDGDGLCTAEDACPYDSSASADDDLDDDSVCNHDDVCDGDDLADADNDGMADACDDCPDDDANDADADGVCGDVDTCEGDDAVDPDADGIPSACDTVCPDDPTNDADSDGVCGESDPCPFDYSDDSDADGSCDSDDVCPDADDLLDTDGEGVPDCLDACPADVENDGDGDGICESDDNCAGVANADQSDADGDSIGDACEPDSDGDGDGDGAIDDLCPTTVAWKNHGAYVSCVAQAANALARAGWITSAQKSALVDAAAQSNVGR